MPGAKLRPRCRDGSACSEERDGARRWALLHRVPWRRLLPGQRPERDQNGSGGMPIFCATTNPVEVVVAETDQGRGLLGVIDGLSPKGIEGEDDVAWRKNLLRQSGYKL